MIEPVYSAAENRYECGMQYRRAGRSGVMLPAISLGLWHNFGDVDTLSLSRKKLHYAFDHGITHFDLANNYGPSYGSAEETFGQIMKSSFAPYRDELFISTKAGHDMWPGPYGNWGSRKHLMASLDQSLKRMNLDYVDVFYSHRYDPDTPLEETLQALADIVRKGKALYVGLAKYPLDAYLFACHYLRERDVPCLLYQGRYSMLVREPESQGILNAVKENGCGFVAFSRLAQGLLTSRYLHGIPKDSRVNTDGRFLHADQFDEKRLNSIRSLNEIAAARGESLAQKALKWEIRDGVVTSVLNGASRPAQILENLKVLNSAPFTEEELKKIDQCALSL